MVRGDRPILPSPPPPTPWEVAPYHWGFFLAWAACQGFFLHLSALYGKHSPQQRSHTGVVSYRSTIWWLTPNVGVSFLPGSATYSRPSMAAVSASQNISIHVYCFHSLLCNSPAQRMSDTIAAHTLPVAELHRRSTRLSLPLRRIPQRSLTLSWIWTALAFRMGLSHTI